MSEPLSNVTTLMQLGNEAFQREDYPRALHLYQQALEGVRGDPEPLADLYGNIANVYGATGQVEEARAYYEKAADILRAFEDYGRLGITFANLGNLEVDRHNPDEAIRFYKQAELLLEQEGKGEALAMVYANLSLALLQKDDLAAALVYAERGMAVAQPFRDSRLHAAVAHRLAKALGASNRLDDALRTSRTAYALYAQLHDEMGMAAALYHQAAVYEAMNNLESATACMTQVVAFDRKYHLPKLPENEKRLAALTSIKGARVAPSIGQANGASPSPQAGACGLGAP